MYIKEYFSRALFLARLSDRFRDSISLLSSRYLGLFL
jgi:hypothetical protein